MSTASSDEQVPPAKLSRVPAWVPFATFAGTSIALAIPLVVLARRRQGVLRKALSNKAPPPPRRAGSSASSGPVLQPRTIPAAPQPVASTSESSSKADFTMPGTGELLSAIGKSDLGNALFAGKALAIATGIVTVGAVTTVVGVKAFMGVNDTREFADKLRVMMWRAFPGLTSTIHRPPSADETESGVSYSTHDEAKTRFIETWSWPEAEKRLQHAWDNGGFATWARVAGQELEAELQIERAKRLREYEEANASKKS